jgi:hypothetical protein
VGNWTEGEIIIPLMEYVCRAGGSGKMHFISWEI